MADRSRKRTVLGPLQPQEALKRRGSKRKTSQDSRQESLVKDENDENDDGARERKLAGKTKEKGNCRGRPLGSTGKGINRATFQSPVRTSHTSRSKSAPHSSTRRNGDKRLLSLDKREATCLSRGHPFNLICSNCRENSNAHSAGQAQKQCEQLFIFDNCTNNRKKASFNHIKDWEEKRLSTGLTDLHGSAAPALKKDDAVVVENASGSNCAEGLPQASHILCLRLFRMQSKQQHDI
jgi:hypothetical protein